MLLRTSPGIAQYAGRIHFFCFFNRDRFAAIAVEDHAITFVTSTPRGLFLGRDRAEQPFSTDFRLRSTAAFHPSRSSCTVSCRIDRTARCAGAKTKRKSSGAFIPVEGPLGADWFGLKNENEHVFPQSRTFNSITDVSVHLIVPLRTCSSRVWLPRYFLGVFSSPYFDEHFASLIRSPRLNFRMRKSIIRAVYFKN